MINFITIINIDTPTWLLPTNTNVPKHTQNSYGIIYIKISSFKSLIYINYFYIFTEILILKTILVFLKLIKHLKIIEII
jgi:hypothetical protein